METYTVRVWLPDRPGALGAVASRIGAVRGEIVGLEILERGGGRAVDDLVVELPDGALVDLLVAEIAQVDGVDVEDVQPAIDNTHDPRLHALDTAALPIVNLHAPRLHALETAAQLVASSSAVEIVASLCERAAATIGAQWAV